MRWFGHIFFVILISAFIASCDETPKPPDTLSKGVIDISADETYQPMIEAEQKVFDSIYPDAKITIHYKSEAECFKDYFNNKARIILVTRGLSKAEKDFCAQKKIFPTSIAVARDAVAVIVNNESADTILDMNGLKGILTGVYKTKYTIVFDNAGSSTLRYITDSVLRGDTLCKNVFAAKGSKEVIDYVSKNPAAIGFVGMSYVYVDEDTSRAGTFIQNVKVVALRDTTMEFCKPYQAYIAFKFYPLSRDLYYINSESYEGLGTGFANFLASQRGQLVFAHSHFFPLWANIQVRDAGINNQ